MINQIFFPPFKHKPLKTLDGQYWTLQKDSSGRNIPICLRWSHRKFLIASFINHLNVIWPFSLCLNGKINWSFIIQHWHSNARIRGEVRTIVARSRKTYQWKGENNRLADKVLIHVPHNGNWLLIKKKRLMQNFDSQVIFICYIRF